MISAYDQFFRTFHCASCNLFCLKNREAVVQNKEVQSEGVGRGELLLVLVYLGIMYNSAFFSC